MNAFVARALSGLAVGVAALLSVTTASAGTIAGSEHDFSARGFGSTQLCIFCHTPHNALAAGAGAPLWNHASSVATYTVYASPTMNATVAQPGTSSKLCLSCHDGTVAINSYGGATGTSFIGAGRANLGTNLSNDHPIGFTYDAALVTADPGLAPITTSVTIGSGTDIKTGTIATNMLIGGNVECASCHDVHNKFTAAGGGLLKFTMTASGMCMQCHKK